MATTQLPEQDVAKGDPTKEFFVEMLTRDISLVDCIRDLVDNSIHQLAVNKNLDVMQTLLRHGRKPRVHDAPILLELSEGTFRIVDRSGGMTVEHAKNHAFRMGDASKDTTHSGLGVFGIGMKRAALKIGRDITVVSRTEREKFELRINVDEWLADKTNWDFNDFRHGSLPPRAGGGDQGTEIVIKKLNPGIGEKFRLTSFQNEVRTSLSSTYALFLDHGIGISVNEEQLHSSLPTIAQTGSIKPVRKQVKFEQVDILIIAGVISTKDRRPRGGWYLFCNGRMVVEADKSELTGWGDTLPRFANKHNHFVGYVYFHSRDPYVLPWKTTKHGINQESTVYQAALSEMQIQAKPIVKFLSSMYPGEGPEGALEKKILASASEVTIDQVPKKSQQFSARAPRGFLEDVSIIYQRPRKEIERISEFLGRRKMSARKVGEYTFDYYIDKVLKDE